MSLCPEVYLIGHAGPRLTAAAAGESVKRLGRDPK